MLARGTAIVFAPAEDTRLSPAGAGRGGATRVRRTAVSRGAEVRLARWKCERVVPLRARVGALSELRRRLKVRKAWLRGGRTGEAWAQSKNQTCWHTEHISYGVASSTCCGDAGIATGPADRLHGPCRRSVRVWTSAGAAECARFDKTSASFKSRPSGEGSSLFGATGGPY